MIYSLSRNVLVTALLGRIELVPRMLLLLLTLAFLAACSGGGGSPTEEPLDPRALLDESVVNLSNKHTFRLIVDRSGADYLFQTDLGPVIFDRAEGQYLASDTLGAKVKVKLGELPVEADVYAQGDQQWVRGIWTANAWSEGVIAPGFSPSKILSGEDSGLSTAMTAMVDPQLVGEEQLEDGTAVYHITATAEGAEVAALVVNLIQMAGTVNTDVYIDKNTRLPLRFIVVQPDTATDDQPDPTTWTIDLFDFDAEPALDVPDTSASLSESTTEAIQEATAEATPG